MKWRHSLIYLMVLLLLAGYYYYFEVVRKEQKETAEREAKRVFHFKIEEIDSVEIKPKEKKALRLLKEGGWKIIAPIESDVDDAALEGLLGSLSSLEAERNIAREPKNLEVYGLKEPALEIKLGAGNNQFTLLVGNKNPVGDAYYAKTGGKDVFLISQALWGVLNKGLDELRRRELFTFNPTQVAALEIEWNDARRLLVKKSEPDERWVCPDQAEVKIKPSKVENVLDQIKWLRAQKFLENGTSDLEKHGLAPPVVKVHLTFDDGESADLLVGEKLADEDKVPAMSSQLAAVVLVDSDILDDVPKSIRDLEDRSIVAFKSDEVEEVRWELGGVSGRVVRLDEDKWGWQENSKKPTEIENSWKVASLLYDLKEAEYIKKVEPGPEAPAEPYGRIQFMGEGKNLVTIQWQKPAEDAHKTRIIWVQKDDTIQAVEVEPELMEGIQDDLQGISPMHGAT